MKLKLKKWMGKVAKEFLYTKETIATGITAYKACGIVTINFDGSQSFTPSAVGYYTLGTTSFKPRERIVFGLMDDHTVFSEDSNARPVHFSVINTNGTIGCWCNLTNRAVTPRGSVTYVVGGVLRNPVIARLTAIFTSLLSGGDVNETEAEKNADEAVSPPNTHHLTRIPRRHKHSKLGLLWVHSLKCAKRSNNYRVYGGVVYEHSGVLHTCLFRKYSIHSRYAKCNDNKLENTDYVYIHITISERRWAA